MRDVRELLGAERTLFSLPERDAMRVVPDDTDGAAAVREVVTARARYRLAGTLLPPGLLTPGPAVAVLVERVTPVPIPVDDLRARFGLTAREAEVARLVAAGRRNAAVAAALGISAHTARRHAERVMRKLGAASRAEVAARVRAEEG
jgi:DNA-binding CsgD family transcriptional regulator